MALNTGASSPGELAITCKTSLVAVCFQRLAEIVGALAQFIEQPRILNGDNGLGSETGQQFDLLVIGRPDFLAIDGNRTDKHIFLQQRDGKERTDAGNLYAGDCHRVAFNGVWRIGLEIGDMDDLLSLSDPHDRSLLARLMYTALHELEIGLGHAEQGNPASDRDPRSET